MLVELVFDEHFILLSCAKIVCCIYNRSFGR